LTRAAAGLRRSLQSVSRSLAALEAQLGVVLIRRTTRTAVPTEAGLAFHRRVSAAFREIALAEAELCDTSETLSGTLRIAGSAFFISHHVVPIIRDFSLQHPGVRFDLRISEEFAEPIRTGFDLMIRIGQLPASPMKSRRSPRYDASPSLRPRTSHSAVDPRLRPISRGTPASFARRRRMLARGHSTLGTGRPMPFPSKVCSKPTMPT